MERLEKSYNLLFREGLLCFSFLFLFYGQLIFRASESFALDSTCARVLEMEGVIESKISGEKTRLLRAGDFVKTGEELSINKENWIVLIMADSTVRKFNGPATLTIKGSFPKTGANILARVSSGLVGLLFSQGKESPEAVMATRGFENWQENKSHLPLLIHPAPGSSVLEKPTRFEWQMIDGIELYRASVYSFDHLLWQGTTSKSYIDCPLEYCDFQPGQIYYWLVEGLIGNSALSSKAANFKILNEDTRSKFYTLLREADSSCPNPELAILIKVRLCLDLDLYDKALELVDSYLKKGSSDRRVYLLRAEIKEKMGFLEDAYLDIKNASVLPSTR